MCGGQVRAFRVRLGSARQTRGHNSKYYFASNLRIEFNSRRRFAVVLGYAILSSLSASRTIWEQSTGHSPYRRRERRTSARDGCLSRSGKPHKPPCNASSISSRGDRKSTRLNSSHLVISYAVFCLKKKKKKNQNNMRNTTASTPIT